MPINYNPSQPYRLQTFRSDGWDGGDKNPPEYCADLEEAIEQGVMLLSTGKWDKVIVEHWESGMYGWGWYRTVEIEQGTETETERTDTDGQNKNHG